MGRLRRKKFEGDNSNKNIENTQMDRNVPLNRKLRTPIVGRKILADQTNSSNICDTGDCTTGKSRNLKNDNLKLIDKNLCSAKRKSFRVLKKDESEGIQMKERHEANNKEEPVPAYALKRLSPINKQLAAEERIHLYDFEVDENEPINRKHRRKPIKKIIRFRTYSDRMNMIGSALSKSKKKGPDKQNSLVLNPVAGASGLKLNKKKRFSRGSENKEPLNDLESVHCKLRNKRLDPGKEQKQKKEQTEVLKLINSSITGNDRIYSAEGYVDIIKPKAVSPKLPRISEVEDPYSLPILFPNISKGSNDLSEPIFSKSLINNSNQKETVFEHKLDISAVSSQTNRSNYSFQNSYTLHDIHIGSSTPIRNHWAETSSLINRTDQFRHFDISNCFGFEEEECFEEPLVSPIKSYQGTPVKPPEFVKATPNRPSYKHVIRMLKFGPDSSTHSDEDEENSPIELPSVFFHDGDTPPFSPKRNQMTMTSQKLYRFGKKMAFSESIESENEENEDEQKELNIKRQNKRKGPASFALSSGEVTRRSYTRIRKKVKYAESSETEDEESEEEEISVLKQNIKRKGPPVLSKKDELELENWANAFNQQCMEVEKFNLCVE